MLEPAPGVQLITQAVGLTKQALRALRVVPEIGAGAAFLELPQPGVLGV
jgi:hypothetical protein